MSDPGPSYRTMKRLRERGRQADRNVAQALEAAIKVHASVAQVHLMAAGDSAHIENPKRGRYRYSRSRKTINRKTEAQKRSV